MTKKELRRLAWTLRKQEELARHVSMSAFGAVKEGLSERIILYEYNRGVANAFAASAALLESYLDPTQDGGCIDD
jgi:hypothetical protein